MICLYAIKTCKAPQHGRIIIIRQSSNHFLWFLFDKYNIPVLRHIKNTLMALK